MIKKMRLTKWFAIMTTVVSMNVLTTPVTYAQSPADAGTNYLALIAEYTNGTLQAVNNLPAYLNALVAMATAWITQDNSQTTASLQNAFTNVSNILIQGTSAQLGLQQQLTSDFFGSSATPQTLPGANDLAYETMLGQPFFNPDPRKTDNSQPPNSAYNYTKNISGINVTHVIPGTNWTGSAANQKKYASFFTTVSAIQTYDAYILSQLYTDYANGTPLTAAQQALYKQASGSDWFSQVASENIGWVLRQILMFVSQEYILISQSNDVQKKILQTQAMTNTLLILGNQQSEAILLRAAIGG